MVQDMTAEDKFRMMTEEPVERLICTLAVPTIVSMLITSIYNMADTYFVSKIGTSASGAVGVSFSLMAIIQAIGFTFGTGSGNYISRLLGQQNKDYAEKVAATGFYFAFGLRALIGILGLIFLEPLVFALGSTETIAPYARDYIRYILLGTPFIASSFVMNHVLRFQGSAFYAMIGIGLGGVLNIILDPIFIFTLNMGTGGAALATIISQFVSFLLLLRNSGRGGNIRIKFKNFTPTWKVFTEIIRGGLPSFYRQTLASTAMICLNFASGTFGDAAVAAMSIVARVFQFAFSSVLGFGQGFQPVCGFNYGAKRYDRVLEAFWFSIRTLAMVLFVISAAGVVYSTRIIALFRKEDIDVITIGARALKYQSLTLPLTAGIVPANMLLQTIGKDIRASMVSVARQGLFFLPAILLLPGKFGILGVQMSQPIADVLSFVFGVAVSVGVIKELNRERQKSSVCLGKPGISNSGA